MKIKQIRNATIRVEYAGTTFLFDPWLAPKGVFCMAEIPGRPFHIPDPVKEQIPMPLYGLPESVDDVLKGVDCYIVTHLHPDHIDFPSIGFKPPAFSRSAFSSIFCGKGVNCMMR